MQISIPRLAREAIASQTCSIELRSAIGPVNLLAVPNPAVSKPTVLKSG